MLALRLGQEGHVGFRGVEAAACHDADVGAFERIAAGLADMYDVPDLVEAARFRVNGLGLTNRHDVGDAYAGVPLHGDFAYVVVVSFLVTAPPLAGIIKP